MFLIIDKEKIFHAKEKLGDRNAYIMVEELGIEDFDEKNMKSCCPFHDEKTPSFIYNSKTYSFHCFGACAKSYDIIDVFMYKGNTFIESVKKLFDLAEIHYSFGSVGVKTKHQYVYPKEVKLNDKHKVYEYAKLRSISPRTIDYADVRQDEYGNVVFNYYDLNDVLTMVKYRPSHKVTKGEPKNWCQKGADTTPLLFNMNRINTSNPLLITCGEFDCLAAIESGFTNAVSIPLGDGNLNWINENWDWLEQFKDILVCYDNDDSGRKFIKDCVSRLGSWRCKIVNIPDFYELNSGKRVYVKDINEVLSRFGKNEVLRLISEAKDSPVPSLKDFSEIEDINLSDIDGVTTGIKGIDREIMRFFYGTLTIVSGTPGSGKTSFLYQIINNAIDNGIGSWMFSRELPEWMTKNWMLYILAGNRNISEYTTKDGVKYYTVNNNAKKEISSYYKDLLHIYRDDYPNDVSSLQKSMEDAVRKYGCKLFVLDNLTTINLNENDMNKNDKQTEFVNWLIQFSMKFSVATILVCHPRKMQEYTENVGLYDISGTSNIINLAHRAIGLKRVTKKEKAGYQIGRRVVPPCKYDVIVNVIKDRMRGRANFEYGLYYDIPSKRFFSTPEEYDRQYSWDKKTYASSIEYPIRDDNDAEIFGVVD